MRCHVVHRRQFRTAFYNGVSDCAFGRTKVSLPKLQGVDRIDKESKMDISIGTDRKKVELTVILSHQLRLPRTSSKG